MNTLTDKFNLLSPSAHKTQIWIAVAHTKPRLVEKLSLTCPVFDLASIVYSFSSEQPLDKCLDYIHSSTRKSTRIQLTIVPKNEHFSVVFDSITPLFNCFNPSQVLSFLQSLSRKTTTVNDRIPDSHYIQPWPRPQTPSIQYWASSLVLVSYSHYINRYRVNLHYKKNRESYCYNTSTSCPKSHPLEIPIRAILQRNRSTISAQQNI